MKPKILLTSFETWLPHQNSNSSDDLLAEIAKLDLPQYSFSFLRKMPVDTSQASSLVIGTMEIIKPDAVICCGMAESRLFLTVESNACEGEKQLYTSLDLKKVVAPLKNTQISHDAGKYVCEALYYEVLNYLKISNFSIPCLFVHVPIITQENLTPIVADFQLILEQIGNLIAANGQTNRLLSEVREQGTGNRQ